MRIPLTQDKFTIINDEDLDKELTTIVGGEKVTVRICDRKWYIHLSHGNFYAMMNVRLKNGKWGHLRLHRLILGIPPDSKLQCDHINRDSLDNRRENLRWVTHSQNQANGRSRRNSSSKYVGVCWYKLTKKWMSRIRFEGEEIYIGLFDNEVDAAKAYDRKKRELYGDDIYSLNFASNRSNV